MIPYAKNTDTSTPIERAQRRLERFTTSLAVLERERHALSELIRNHRLEIGEHDAEALDTQSQKVRDLYVTHKLGITGA